jgi:CheY-like chemotaxis protein
MSFELRVDTDLSRRLHACSALLTALCQPVDHLLPTVPPRPPPMRRPALAIPPPYPVLDVLIIDDDRDTRVLLDYVCTAAGYQVDHASNGASGLAMTVASTPRLVLLDVHLPDMHGLAVADTLTTLPIPVVPAICLMTGDTGVAAPAITFPIVTKPFALDALVMQLASLLDPPAA